MSIAPFGSLRKTAEGPQGQPIAPIAPFGSFRAGG
jgi:hypothetical protein